MEALRAVGLRIRTGEFWRAVVFLAVWTTFWVVFTMLAAMAGASIRENGELEHLQCLLLCAAAVGVVRSWRVKFERAPIGVLALLIVLTFLSREMDVRTGWHPILSKLLADPIRGAILGVSWAAWLSWMALSPPKGLSFWQAFLRLRAIWIAGILFLAGQVAEKQRSYSSQIVEEGLELGAAALLALVYCLPATRQWLYPSFTERSAESSDA